MEDFLKYNIPWELIAESLTGSLTAESEIKLQQWLTTDPVNKEKYLQIRELWMKGMEDYRMYRLADENKAWQALRYRMEESGKVKLNKNIIQWKFSNEPKFIRSLIAIAAVVVVLVGMALWFKLSGNKFITYETASNEYTKIILKDNSVITIKPQTVIKVSRDFNKVNRTIVMVSGEAYFDANHQKDKPFIVELGITQIKDLGTRFDVKKDKNEINVSVEKGKVAFVKITTNETRELEAGTTITYNIGNESFGNIREYKPSLQIREELLSFDNTPLSEVIIKLRKVYGKNITIGNPGIANKKITAHLDGVSYNTAMEIICKSLGLEYSRNDSVYILKEKLKEQP